ncbi:glycosyl hydrolase family 8 [Ornithinibacillus salinisoli]|uniref:Glycosyl hydrolase family 8 n=1 Tax=Ornithinibacillus salinisoli TaxID=1848459 RepID=A0ABW4VWZ4_9BACI
MNKIRAFLIPGLLFIIIFIGVKNLEFKSNENTVKETLLAESFVKNHLYEKNGLIKTDLLNQSDIYLSESIGLWMEYLVEKNDRYEFHKQYNVLKDYFMKDSTLIPWRIEGEKLAPANALLDDLRIAKALSKAGEIWHTAIYTKTAKKIGEAIVQYNMQSNGFINHADIKSKQKGDILTLSYIDPDALHFMYEEKILTANQYDLNLDTLLEAPLSKSGFFPETYYHLENSYTYNSEVNLIDQYYIGYHRALGGGDVSALVQFTKDALTEYDGVLYGRFSDETKDPVVDYEGASVYALAILMCLEVEENALAIQLNDRMKDLQVADESEEYGGGYISLNNLDTHAFDNLLPLLAERRGIDEGVFQ